MKNRIATGTLAIVAGIAIGWFAIPTEKPSASSDKTRCSQILRKLVEAGEIIDTEQQILAARAAFADSNAADLEALKEPVMKLAKRRPDINLREEFLRRWGELAPQKALAYLGSESRPSERAQVFTAWGRTDPDGAAENFRPGDKELSDVLKADARALLAGIAEADAEKAIRFADRSALADLTRLEFDSYSNGMMSLPSFSPWGSYEIAISSWIQDDPAKAFEVMISLKSIKVREQALHELCYDDWPYQDLETSHAATIRLLEKAQLEGDSRAPLHRKDLVASLAENYGASNSAKACELAIVLSDPNLRLAAVEVALGLKKEVPPPEHLTAAADFVAMRLNSDAKAANEPEVLVHAAEWTARWLTENGKNDENDEGMVKAADWMQKLPAGDARDAAIRGIVSAFDRLQNEEKLEKFEKLEKWANALPPSHQKDVAIGCYVTKISEKEPAKALDMAATIEDSTLRAEALAHVAARFISKEEGGTMILDINKWMKENPEIAEELLPAKAPN